MKAIKFLFSRGGVKKQATIVVFSDAIKFASGLISSMILARIISITLMGTYRQLMYLGLLAVSLTELGLSTSIYRFWNSFDQQKLSSYAKMLVLISLCLGGTGTLVLALSAPLFAALYHNPDLKMALLISAPLPLATLPLMLLRPILISQGNTLKGTLLETSFTLVNIFSLIIPLQLGASLQTSLTWWIGFSILRLAFVPVVLKPYLWQSGTWFDKKLFHEMWSYLWPIQISRLPGYFTYYFDKVIMSLFLSKQNFAVYSMGAREIPFVGEIGPSVSNVLLPNLMLDVQAGNYEQIRRRWRTACEKTAMFIYPIAAFCIWHAVPVMRFLFSSTYTESSVPFRAFAAISFIRIIEFASIPKLFGKTEIIMYSSFISAATMILFGILLTWLWGPLGMALAFFFATIITAGYLVLSSKKLLQSKRLSDFFPWPRLIMIFVISTACVMGSDLLIGAWINIKLAVGIPILMWKLASLFSLSGIFYLLFLIAFGIVKPVQVRRLLSFE